MIVRRKVWLYRTHDSLLAQRVEFTRAVTKKEAVALIMKHYKKIAVELWGTR